MKSTLNIREFYLIFFTITFVGLLSYLGATNSNMVSVAIACASIFFIYYAFNIKKTFWHFLLVIPFLPPYFAVQLGSLPVVTAFRAILILFIIDQLLIKKRLPDLLYTIRKDRLTPIIFLYSLGVMIPGFIQLVSQNDTTAFIGSSAILIEKVLLYYLVVMNVRFELKKDNGKIVLDKILHTLCLSAFIVSICGIVEYITKFNVFHLLEISPVDGISSSSSTYIRQGNLRISASFLHSLGYGLYLLLMIPIAYYQANMYKNKNKNRYFFYSILFILLLTSVLLTYSRSTLVSLLAVSFVVFFVFSNLKRKIVIFCSAVFLFIPILALSLTPVADDIPVISTIGGNTKALSDAFFGTHLVQDFGKNSEPFTYRNELINFAFNEQESFEDIFGKGIGFIRTEPLVFNIPELNPYGPTISTSVDNYYINVKLELGWIGFTTTLLFLISALLFIIKHRKASFFNTILLVSFSGYLFELTMVGELYTMQYFWIMLAVCSTFISFKNKNDKPTLA
ncbi:O-antigen ligase family protein [Ectobacillus funiculus]|uniref:O-antigen ligase family protein n=1 Tax=Ectobacillus funiculus TaxID=137993 RepID=UPI0013ED0FB9|nr:O-antigen ligase family protein [Ectobacillus funiculus]